MNFSPQDTFLSESIKNLKNQFFEDNTDLTDFQKMAWEFYYEVQEMCHDYPNWVEKVTELLKEVKKGEQFKSSTPEK